MVMARTLANGNVTVWQEDRGMVIHHASGLTIALTPEETEELLEWMNEDLEEEEPERGK